MDTEQTTEQQLLAEARKQTKAVELLAVLAQVWSVLAALGLVTWLFLAFAAGR
jgi:hypothetical protein